jgi:exonuclease SbcC
LIIDSLILQNIRSYKNAVINFTSGTTLFEGDIGSGKSTILMAIEFALFGLGSEKGISLLRTGESEGKVELNLEIDEKKYKIVRALIRKDNSARQSQGLLKTEKGVFHLSPTEMKERILTILNFNEPIDPKAQSIIYRYAVFTPQEEMKTILFLRPDLRLQTLRKAFGIEDYKIASENASKAARAINIRILELESAASDLEEVKKKIDEKKNKVVREEKINLSKIIGSLPLLAKSIEEKNEQKIEIREKINSYKKKIDELTMKITKLDAVKKPTEKTESELNFEIGEIEREEKQLRKIETEIKAKLSDYRSVEEKKRCPTCDRAVNPKIFKQKINSKIGEMNDASSRVENCTEKLEELKEILKKLQQYDRILERLDIYKEQIKNNEEEVKSGKDKISILENEVKESEKRLESTKEEKIKLDRVSGNAQKTETEVKNFEAQVKQIRDKIIKAKTRIADLKKEILEYKEQVNKKEEQRKKATLLNDYYIWLEDFFIKTLDTIEKHVMMNINQDLNQNFQKWFNMLVEDPSKEARIDEDFTPIIEQDGYEQDLYYLSGGEKTSIAFAYRVALNDVVRKVSTGMKSNLLILDEPTDGLSKEQLSRVREILDELYCPQIIIVSHEKELESFADQIFRVSKTEGESKIIT